MSNQLNILKYVPILYYNLYRYSILIQHSVYATIIRVSALIL